MAQPAAKRRRVDHPSSESPQDSTAEEGQPTTSLSSLVRDITPPPRSKKPVKSGDDVEATLQGASNCGSVAHSQAATKIVPSPFHLSHIRDLPASHNIDTIGLKALIGDPLIRELWLFDFLFDADFVMQNLDDDVRSLIAVKIVHGSWRREDNHRIRLELAAKQYENVEVICAHMPEAFGTHHSKMMVIFKRDDTAEVVIHTANMISKDWANMTQALWRSLSLQLLEPALAEDDDLPSGPIGSGVRFKSDLTKYLQTYERRTKALVKQLRLYDFGHVRAAFIASAPSRQHVTAARSDRETAFGSLELKQILSAIPSTESKSERGSINIQISSVATLSEKWLQTFLTILETRQRPSMFERKPRFSIIFPTPDEVRRSLDGYESGGSIHMKIQSAAQQKQLAMLRPMLKHWASDVDEQTQPSIKKPVAARKALRSRAAPHIKTYIRFKDHDQTEIEWAMITSANLSQQAWGALPDKDGQTRICSYEVGVVVWPALFAADENQMIKMVPVFGRDDPIVEVGTTGGKDDATTVVGLRMPYDLPLIPYQKHEMPWCATSDYAELDWTGKAWSSWSV